jgi:DNA repair photolyase
MRPVPRAVSNPPLRFQAQQLVASEELDQAPALAALEPIEETAKSILSENDSPDVGFRWSINPYRGCYHACAYCYARPTHAYLGLGSGTDFDRKIVVKVNAPELLEEAFAKRSWAGELIAFSGNTDCYQPLEAKYRLTRRLLEVCAAHKSPVGVITKSALVLRDLDLLRRLAADAHCRVTISAAFKDDDTARGIEPGASSITKRFEAMRALADAGIEVGISLAPVIPGLNDDHLPALLERAKACGASYAFIVLLRLPLEVLPVFRERLAQVQPLRAQKVENAIREMRLGKMNESAPGERMRGHGARWAAIEQLFQLHVKRLGLNLGEAMAERPTTFERPKRQLALF